METVSTSSTQPRFLNVGPHSALTPPLPRIASLHNNTLSIIIFLICIISVLAGAGEILFWVSYGSRSDIVMGWWGWSGGESRPNTDWTMIHQTLDYWPWLSFSHSDLRHRGEWWHVHSDLRSVITIIIIIMNIHWKHGNIHVNTKLSPVLTLAGSGGRVLTHSSWCWVVLKTGLETLCHSVISHQSMSLHDNTDTQVTTWLKSSKLSIIREKNFARIRLKRFFLGHLY